MAGTERRTRQTKLSRLWPWLVILLTALVAAWHVLEFPTKRDPEFPRVVRPTFNRRPPGAYRLAEPGDTLDRIAIYVSAAAVVLALSGYRSKAHSPLWPAALALSLAALWHAATPGPTFDGWHGLGWRTIGDARASAALRVALLVSAAALAIVVVRALRRAHSRWSELREIGRLQGINALLVAAFIFVVLRQVEIPGVEPQGYWPRCFFDIGILAFDLALLKAVMPFGAPRLSARIGFASVAALAWFLLVLGGIHLTWYHRPLERLRTVVPGKIYISAMPTKRGLEIAQDRHGFKTIIDLFPEDTLDRSPHLPDELRFAKVHGIRYIGNQSDALASEGFIAETLKIAQDPNAWPILVHCHGCMDRTPAWLGIYRFVIQGRPLDEIFRELEQHRGHRPKASVTLLYNHVLPRLAPQHYVQDPTAALLKRFAADTPDPYAAAEQRSAPRPNPQARSSVSPRKGPRAGLPNLTPERGSLEYERTLSDPHIHEPAISS